MLGNFKRIHFIGIGGTGMSGIAKIVMELGYEVSGSDLKFSEALNRLKEEGARVFIGHDAANIRGADLVVISSAIPPTNPEYVEAIKNNIPVIHRADMLSMLMAPRKGIAVTGAHGKTTTTSMISLVLEKSGMDPTVVIGGELNDIGGNATLGKGEYMVAEADESDGSFLKLTPYIAVVTNIENDHLDHYKDMDRMKEAYRKFITSIKEEGFALLGTDNENVRDVMKRVDVPCITYGINYPADYMPKNVRIEGVNSRFEVYYRDERLGELELHVPGMHNIYNATAAVAVGHRLGLRMEDIAGALKAFRGVQRRFQLIGEVGGVRVIDDYAHHPTEIKATLKAAKLLNPRKLYVIFQPHRYTRTKMLAEEFGDAFKDADEVIITRLYSAGEKPIDGVSSMLIVEALKRKGKNVTYIDDKEEIPDYIAKRVISGDCVFTIGAGDIYAVAFDTVRKLEVLYG
ncbi:UDP-N-acetylmuramate--L-alanine ligase [Thermosediminibacter litoriperuensis]|uniref:UDP-N-acetylmuramate--L-alanine ligase n=1 Tax=Thermosediminibacter litoriperuensis TaxID=291989 RepID=A0A5S5ASC2_9FIRM|nr:UDP-N-acetylmuramate--L-alanine ligase [Thermosediminibacter litoriperuensis]TYP54941.1 UDP-N-acetylmuramate--L-alanine ligase [Thermosediminibacter litoriperuensis]